MKESDFVRVLEEIGLAAWHGDGRTTTVREIEEHCRTSGLNQLLDAFQEGAKSGVTRLLAAFFFRQYGQRPSGDPTFAFTHKSFGEYLAAKRIVRAMERIVRELADRKRDADRGWNEQDALKYWAQICGPSAMTNYLRKFVMNDLALREQDDIAKWQDCMADLFSYMMKQGMPMELLPNIGRFKDMLLQSRNAEEALLVALNACAERTEKLSQVKFEKSTSFGTWLKRIQGQWVGDTRLAVWCLSRLDLEQASLITADLTWADLSFADLTDARLALSCTWMADLRGASLRGANLYLANLERADLSEANLEKASLVRANLRDANLTGAKIEGADFEGANLEGCRGISPEDQKRLTQPKTPKTN